MNFNKIYEYDFEVNYYKFIELIFNDQSFINKTYNVIDDLIKSFKLDRNKRFLIIGDFLFSIVSYGFDDPFEFVLKIERNSYINKIKLRASINTIFGIKPDDYILLHQKLLIGLVLNNTLIKKEVKIKKDNWEKIIYFQLNINNSKEINLEKLIPLGFSEKPFKIINIDSKAYLISSFRNVWKCRRKKRELEGVNLSNKILIKSNQIKIRLSTELLNLNKEVIDEIKKKLLKESESSSLKNYFSKLKLIINDNKYLNMLLFSKKEKKNFKELLSLKKTINESYYKLMKNFQKITSISILKRKDIWDIDVYLPSYGDNRNRIYYGTLISHTFYKIFRYLYEFSDDKELKHLKQSKY